MKKRMLVCVALVLPLIATLCQQKHFFASIVAQAALNKPREAMPNLQGQPAIDYLKQHGLFERVRAEVEADRHEIRWQSQTGRVNAGWRATNPGQNLEATFLKEGVQITPGESCAVASWQMALRLRGVGYGERLSSLVSGPMRAKGNRIEFEKLIAASEQQSTISEWYVNKPEGIEQGFTLSRRPGASFGIEPLRVAMSVEGGLRASLTDDGHAVALGYQKARQALRYDHLVAYDSLGRTLASRMEVRDGEISLLVDDASAVYPVTIDPVFTEVKKLTASDRAVSDQFGYSVAISGDTALVGARSDDSAKGAAYVFERNKTGADLWGEVKKLTASDGAVSDQFGFSVALSGDTAIVGAYLDDSNKGAAYIFERNKTGADLWGEVKKLTASDGVANDQFGSSVAISGDTALVGARGDDGGKGAAYVCERNKTGADLWGEVKKLTASDGVAGDLFGSSVAISGDTAIVGALGDDSSRGAAYIFERNKTGADAWGEVKKLTASDGTSSDQFGLSVAISGDTALVGALGDDSGKGAAYVFERNKTGADLWGEVKKLTASDGVAGDQFGISVALSGDTALVGAYLDDSVKGAAYVFERNKTGADLWGEVKKLTASDGVAGDAFGYAVAISGDTAIVGALAKDSGRGAAYIFASECNWAERRKPVASDGASSDQLGVSVAISGDTALVGARGDDSGKGAAYVFERNKTGADLWGEVKKLTASDGNAGDAFGFSVALSGDTAIVGARFGNGAIGAAYVFERNKTGADLWGEVKKLTASDSVVGDQFGWSVAISGETAIVAARRDDSDKGAAYIFERNKTGADLWGEVKKLTASDGVASDQFGWSVALSGDTALVGAFADDTLKGAAYVFERNKTGADFWGEVKKLTASDGVANDFFGYAVALSGGTAIVGAPTNGSGRGAAYVFERNKTGADLWGEVKKLTASDGVLGDQLGYAVAISIDTAIAGAYFDDASKGAAYVFERNKTGGDLWGEVKKLTASDGVAGDQFGVSVAISGDTAIVGAQFDDGNKGAAYVFTCQTNSAPTITGATLSRTQGATGPVSTIATVGDGVGEDPPGNLTVTVLSAPVGITITGITNTTGTITANVAVACTATPGDNTVQLQVQDSGLLTATANLIVNVVEITLPALPGGTAGAAYSQSAAASPAGVYAYSVTGGSVPLGLSLDTSTGLLSGTPTTGGTFNFTITAVGGGCSVSKAYSVLIACPTITLSALPGGLVNTAYNQTITGAPAGTTYTFALTSGTLPTGLTLSPTGALTGSPTQSGVFNFQVTATGFGICTGYRDYTVNIGCPVITVNPASLPGGTLGTAYAQSVSASPAGTYTFSVISGGLPAGLSLNASTGAITGTPIVIGSSTFTIRGAAGGCSGTRSYTLAVVCPTLTITTTTLPTGTAGSNYSQTISVSPAGSYTYSLVQGNLPSGMTLNPATGLISGLPSVPGTYSFIVKAQIVNGCSATQALSVTINCPTVTLNPASLPNGSIGTAYSQMISASPAGIYSFSFTGSLPPGLALSPATGLLSGTPTANGSFSFSVTASTAGGCSGSWSYSVTIAPGSCPTITLPALPGGKVGTLYLKYLTATPAGSYTYSLTGTLPPGLTFYSAMGLVYGYPTTAGSYNFSITATNLNNCTGTVAYSLAIAP